MWQRRHLYFDNFFSRIPLVTVDVEVGGEEAPLLQGGSATAEHRNSRRTDASLLVSMRKLAGLSNQHQR